MVLEGTDQILNRKVSVVVASPSRSDCWKQTPARSQPTHAATSRFSTWHHPEGSRTSSPPTPAPTPCWTPCWSKTTHSQRRRRAGHRNLRRLRKRQLPTPTRRSLASSANQESITAAKNWNASDGAAVTAYSNPPASTRMTKTKKTAAAPGPSPWQQSCCSSSSQAVSSPPWAQSAQPGSRTAHPKVLYVRLRIGCGKRQRIGIPDR